MAGPSPFCSPPKYSETIAAITAPEDAIFNPVKKNGSAPGRRTTFVVVHGVAA
jgi:hypothetical protein